MDFVDPTLDSVNPLIKSNRLEMGLIKPID